MRLLLLAVAGIVFAGCAEGPPQPEFGELHPVAGVVLQAGKTVSGGTLVFTAEPEKPDFLVNAEVNSDGTFKLVTVRLSDKKGERKPGAASGTYRVTYNPPVVDQTSGHLEPITLPKLVTVDAKPNELKLEFPGKR